MYAVRIIVIGAYSVSNQVGHGNDLDIGGLAEDFYALNAFVHSRLASGLSSCLHLAV